MLTGKQMKIYRYIRSKLATTGRAPTYSEMSRETGQPRGNVHHYVDRICSRGWLMRRAGTIALAKDIPATAATIEFDYLVLDYEHHPAAKLGWPPLIEIDLG